MNISSFVCRKSYNNEEVYKVKYDLKKVKESDEKLIYNIKKASNYNYIQKIWGWDEQYQIKDFESDFIKENFKIISASGQDIGFIQVAENSSNINITEIHIMSDHQGNGVGSNIINGIINKANSNRKTVTSGCFIDNFRAKDLYERLGFQITNITDTHYEMKYQLGK